MLKKIKLIFLSLLIVLTLLFIAGIVFYLQILPKMVSNPAVTDYIKNSVSELCGAELLIYKPVLKTSLKPEFEFTVENVFLSKDGETIFNAEKLDSKIDFSKILSKKIILKKLGADDLYVDINKFDKLKFKNQIQDENVKSDYIIEWLNAYLYIKKCAVIYGSPKGVIIKLLAKDINLTSDKEKNYLHFKILVDTDYQKERLRLVFSDKDNVYIQNNQLCFDNFKFKVNKSEIFLNAVIDSNGHFNASLNSDKLEIKNIQQLMDTNLVIPNGREIMSCFKNLNGDFNFNINIASEGINGIIGVNKINTGLVPLANLPLTLTKGAIKIQPEKIDIQDFQGFYGGSQKQDFNMYGEVEDYLKTAKSYLIITATAYDEFTKYVSKLAGIDISLVNTSNVAIKVDFDATGKVIVKGGGKIPKGSNILFEGASISSDKFDRAVGINLLLQGEDLKIEHINYYIADEISAKVTTRPLVTIRGLLNSTTGYLKELEFDVPKPLPSEFFNVLVGQKILRRGTFEGCLKFINAANPKIVGKMILKDVIVSGQRFLIKNAEINANNDYINVVSDGSIRRTKYNFNAKILNKLIFPIVIDKINLDIDELDVEKIMQTFAPRPKDASARPRPNRQNINKSDIDIKYFEVDESSKISNTKDISDTTVEPITFQPNLLIIKECMFNVQKGVYKLINFGNLHANLTLTNDGVLEIQSNKFDFADGISTLKIYCDLMKENYSIRLGAKDVDTDAIATSVLNLSKEITGKSSALLEFYTDKDAKLNGKIQFAINDGSITKLGLVQYVLNMADIFRNPVAMISPSTLLDLVNVPEGTFRKINGKIDIKNNVIERMMIQSASPQLSSFIVGQINLENMDASLRIYTKFSNKNKGIAGFLRNLSFASLSKKLPFNTKEDASYYATELSMLPELEIGEETAQVFLTKADGDMQSANFISSLKKIK